MVRAIVGCVPICVCSSSSGGGRSARGICDVRRFVETNEEAADKYKCALKNGRKRENQKKKKEENQGSNINPKKKKIKPTHLITGLTLILNPPLLHLPNNNRNWIRHALSFSTTRISVLSLFTSFIGPVVPPEPDACPERNESTLEIEVVPLGADPEIAAIFPLPLGLPPAVGLGANVVYPPYECEWVWACACPYPMGNAWSSVCRWA
jgi:hypothetical protein